MTMLNTIRALTAAATLAIAATTAASAAPDDRWFNFTNESEWAVDAVYVTNVDDPNWGPNLLRGNELAPYEYVVLDPRNPQGYCEFDILVVFEDGAELEFDGLDLCNYADVYTDGYDFELVAI
jgi:hypothetical protein